MEWTAEIHSSVSGSAYIFHSQCHHSSPFLLSLYFLSLDTNCGRAAEGGGIYNSEESDAVGEEAAPSDEEDN